MRIAVAASDPARATALQRLRAGGIRLLAVALALLPQGIAEAIAEATGEAYYRLTPSRAAQARRNLARVAAYCASTGAGSERAWAAATDPAALERLVRAAFRNLALIYLQMLRGPGAVRRELATIEVETPDALAAALARGAPAIFVGMHFGSIDLPATFLAQQFGRPTTAPVETLGDPALQALFTSMRRPMGARLVSLDRARGELRAALDRGEIVGIVADRDIAGGGVATTLFGAPAPFPAGPAILALETGLPVYAASVRRLPEGRWAGRVEILPEPPGGAFRDRAEAFLAAEAAAFERQIAVAPEQWWAVFHPIWPDLERPVGGESRPRQPVSPR